MADRGLLRDEQMTKDLLLFSEILSLSATLKRYRAFFGIRSALHETLYFVAAV
jgi:hypothetical protein